MANRKFMNSFTGEVFDDTSKPRNFIAVKQKDWFMSTQTAWKHPYAYDKSFVRDWISRLILEYKSAPDNCCFLTLTFDERHLFRAYSDVEVKRDFASVDADSVKSFFEHCPGVHYYGQVCPPKETLQEHERNYYLDVFQRFMKRLRKYIAYYEPQITDVKYFCVSENGDLLNRFHFHLLLFGVPHNRIDIARIWQNGFVTSRPVSTRSIRYTCKYLFKRHSDCLTFSLKSNGLGLSYVMREDVRNFLKSRQTRVLHVDGAPLFLGRFLNEKVFDENERKKQLDEYYYEQARQCELVNSSDPDGVYYVGFKDITHNTDSVLNEVFHVVMEVSRSDFYRIQNWADMYRKQEKTLSEYETAHRRAVTSKMEELSITNPLYYGKLIKRMKGVKI